MSGQSGEGGGLQEIDEQGRGKLFLHPGGFPRGPGTEQEKGSVLWVGYNSGVHAAILYRKMAVSMPKFLVKRGDPRYPTSAEQVIPAQWVEAFGEGDAPAPPRAGRHANRKDRRRRGILCETLPQLRSGSRDAGCSVASRLRRMMKHTNPRPTTRSSTWTNTTREKWIARCMNNDHVISKPIPFNLPDERKQIIRIACGAEQNTD